MLLEATLRQKGKQLISVFYCESRPPAINTWGTGHKAVKSVREDHPIMDGTVIVLAAKSNLNQCVLLIHSFLCSKCAHSDTSLPCQASFFNYRSSLSTLLSLPHYYFIRLKKMLNIKGKILILCKCLFQVCIRIKNALKWI